MEKSLLEGLIQILTEAPMSDEDRKDTDILIGIAKKRQTRSNAKLTPEEQATLDKYGIFYDTQAHAYRGSEDGVSKTIFPGSSENVADKIRKSMSGERDYAKGVYSKTRHDLKNSVYRDGEKYSFQDRERFLQNKEMRRDYDSVKKNLSARNRANYEGDDHSLYADYLDKRADLEASKYGDEDAADRTRSLAKERRRYADMEYDTARANDASIKRTMDRHRKKH